jgi:hypothetical protein
MLRHVDEATKEISAADVARGIRKFDSANFLVEGTYDAGISNRTALPAAARTAAGRMKAQTVRSSERTGQGTFETFYTAVPDPEKNPEWRDLARTSLEPAVWESVNPVGACGPDLAKSMQYTQAILRDELYKEFRKKSPELLERNKDQLLDHSRRGHLDKELGPITAALEGSPRSIRRSVS